MSVVLEFHGWRIGYDAAATRQAYAQVAWGPEDLPSPFYRNFDAARGQAYPDEVRMLFEQLGIDYRYFGDVWIPSRIANRLHYHGVFHFSGSILRTGEDPIRIEPSFCMTFSVGNYEPASAHELFRQRLPVVQIDFETLVPWLLQEPEPELDEIPMDWHCRSLRLEVVEVRRSRWRSLVRFLARFFPEATRPT